VFWKSTMSPAAFLAYVDRRVRIREVDHDSGPAPSVPRRKVDARIARSPEAAAAAGAARGRAGRSGAASAAANEGCGAAAGAWPSVTYTLSAPRPRVW